MGMGPGMGNSNMRGNMQEAYNGRMSGMGGNMGRPSRCLGRDQLGRDRYYDSGRHSQDLHQGGYASYGNWQDPYSRLPF